MKRSRFVAISLLASVFAASVANAGGPSSFEDAKVTLRQQVYFDQNRSEPGDLYCGCSWRWTGRSGGRMNLDSCGYQTGSQPERAARLEYEHIVPAWTLGHQRQCWQRGGREHCAATDPVYRAMEADMHNLAPTIGEVNAERSNYRFGLVSGTDKQFGACQTKVDQRQRIAEPRDEVKGMVARITFYMADRYDINLSKQQQQLLMAWARQFPVSAWELERDKRIATIVGHSNPFVTGTRRWQLGETRPASSPMAASPPREQHDRSVLSASPIVGNRNSRIYHLPAGCPSYSHVSAKNRVTFDSPEAAELAGFRRAGNCS